MYRQRQKACALRKKNHYINAVFENFKPIESPHCHDEESFPAGTDPLLGKCFDRGKPKTSGGKGDIPANG